MASPSKAEDVDLEDLINCVHIGKTLTTKLSRNLPEIPVSTNPICTSFGDFNPLTMPKSPKVEVDVELEKSADNKRLKLTASKLQTPNSSKTLHAGQWDHRMISDMPVVKVVNQAICNNVELKKTKRKRLLVDEELSLLRTPKCLDPPRKKPFIQKEQNAADRSGEKEKTEIADNKEDHPKILNASTLWLPPSPDSLSEDEKDTNSEPSSSMELKRKVDEEPEQVCTDLAPIAGITACNIVIKDIYDDIEISPQLSCFQTFKIDSKPVSTPKRKEQVKDDVEGSPECNISNPEVADEVSKTTEDENCRSPPAKRLLRSRQKSIRKTLPPLQVRQTPMGLPKPLRLKKEKFSVEEIYTNKNYSTPVPKMWETIFEYPKEEKDGTVRYVERRRKTRAMVFYTNPAERPAKKRRKRQGRRVSTRRNKSENELETTKKLQTALAELDEQLKLHNLSQ